MKEGVNGVQVSLTPCFGGYVEDEKTSNHGRVNFDCKIKNNHGLRVAFRLIVFVKVAQDLNLEKSKIIAFTKFFASKKIEGILNDKYFDLFNNYEDDVSIADDLSLDEKFNKDECDKEIEIILNNDAFENINSQSKEYSKAVNDFDYAVDELREYTEGSPLGIRHALNKINSLIGFLESAVNSGNVDTLFSWYNEKFSIIRGNFSDISRRKNQSHPNYRLCVEQINKALFGFRCPDTWNKKSSTLDR